jgi:hypothetical protein
VDLCAQRLGRRGKRFLFGINKNSAGGA